MCSAIKENIAINPARRFSTDPMALPVAILFGDRLLPLRGI